MASIYESSTDDESDDGYISTNSPKYIHNGIQIYLDINARDARLKIHDFIIKMQIECKGAELSANSMVKVLHKVYKAVVS